MGKVIRNVFKVETLCLTECTDGFWLYDTVVGMNISMRAKTEQDACIEALLYYQKALRNSEAQYAALNDKVENFVSQIIAQDDF